MIDEKIDEIPLTAKYTDIPKDNWIATITLQTECGKDPKSNEAPFDALKQIIKKILSKTNGDGIILFPAGWLNTGKDRVDSIYPQVKKEITEILPEKYDRHIFAVIGIDGYKNPKGYDRDQIGLAIDKCGIQAIARKHYLTDLEIQEEVVPAKGPNELECGKPRIFELNGARYYIAVCYDIYWAHQTKPDNIPDCSVILNLIHVFGKVDKDKSKGCADIKKKGTGCADFNRKGMGLESKSWKCPVFGSVKFINGREIPPKWATGIFWKFDDGVKITKRKGTTVDLMSIDKQLGSDCKLRLDCKLLEGFVCIKIFKDIPQKIEAIPLLEPDK
jgi:hypothetical protein